MEMGMLISHNAFTIISYETELNFNENMNMSAPCVDNKWNYYHHLKPYPLSSTKNGLIYDDRVMMTSRLIDINARFDNTKVDAYDPRYQISCQNKEQNPLSHIIFVGPVTLKITSSYRWNSLCI